jgi:hypothetical protein
MYLRVIYVTSDEHATPTSRARSGEARRDAFGNSCGSDLLPAAFVKQPAPLALWMIDYKIAKDSSQSIGLTSPTFSNVL